MIYHISSDIDITSATEMAAIGGTTSSAFPALEVGSTYIFCGGQLYAPQIANPDSVAEITLNVANVTLIFTRIYHALNGIILDGRAFCDFLRPEYFGATGNGETDDTIAFERCLRSATNTQIPLIKLSSCTYLISHSLYYPFNVHIEGTHNPSLPNVDNGTCIFAKINANNNANNSQGSNNESTICYLLDSDCCDGGNRIDVLTQVPYSGMALTHNGGSYNYAAPPSISGVRLLADSVSPMFGAIRGIGVINASLKNITIEGFKLGISIAKGWNFIIENVNIHTLLYGIQAGAEITIGVLRNINIQKLNNNNVTDDIDWQYFLSATLRYSKTEILSTDSESWYNSKSEPHKRFRRAFNDAYSESLSGDAITHKAFSTGIIANAANIYWEECSIQGFDFGIFNYNSRLLFENPSFANLKRAVVFQDTGRTILRRAHGEQTLLQETDGLQCYNYVCTYVTCRIELEQCSLPGSICENSTVYDNYTYSYRYRPYQIRSRNETSNLAFGNSFIGSRLVEINDFSHILYIASSGSCENWGETAERPITLSDAIDRVNDNYNYRNSNSLVLTTDVQITSQLTINPGDCIVLQSQYSAELLRPMYKTLTVSYPIILKRSIVLRDLNIDVHCDLFVAKSTQNIRIVLENCVITSVNPDPDHNFKVLSNDPQDDYSQNVQITLIGCTFQMQCNNQTETVSVRTFFDNLDIECGIETTGNTQSDYHDKVRCLKIINTPTKRIITP